MQTITDQTPLTPAIGALAREIHKKQAERNQLALERLKADGIAGQAASAYTLEKQQLNDPTAIAASKEHAERARQAFLDVCDRQKQNEQDLFEQHARISALTDAYRLSRALAGRTLAVPAVPSPMATDAQLDKLGRLSADLEAKRATAKAAAATAAADLNTAESRLATMRVDVHRGLAKRSDVTVAERSIAELRATCDRLDQEVSELDAAATAIHEDRRAREEELVSAWVPAVRAEYRARAQTFAEALRVAALAAEAMRPVFQALASVTAVVSEPWNDLFVSEAQSKISRWLDAAIDAGEIE